MDFHGMSSFLEDSKILLGIPRRMMLSWMDNRNLHSTGYSWTGQYDHCRFQPHSLMGTKFLAGNSGQQGMDHPNMSHLVDLEFRIPSDKRIQDHMAQKHSWRQAVHNSYLLYSFDTHFLFLGTLR